tara:strand:+ start:1249 stop:1509 length:261 start_codon:yes stop_codon:yes gene_type:complete
MDKIINIFLAILVFIFFLSVFKFYSSNNNIKIKDFNRNNINQILNNKISDLPILKNDTDSIIEFNDGLSDLIENDKPRSFWNLIKN